MYFEVYIDSLFLINFTMNLYVLLLTNRKLGCSATRFKLFIGALIGAIGYCIVFFIPCVFPIVKNIVFISVVSIGMIKITFQQNGFKAFLNISVTMLKYTFFIGGCFLFLFQRISFLREYAFTVWGMMGLGTVFYLLSAYFIERFKDKRNMICKVLLKNNGKQIKVNALIDTGNSLIEPISGKPVSIIEKRLLDPILEESDLTGFRIIPYRSVGTENGILYAYKIPEIIIEKNGMIKSCKDNYIGISEAAISAKSNYRMIIHPKLMEG